MVEQPLGPQRPAVPQGVPGGQHDMGRQRHQRPEGDVGGQREIMGRRRVDARLAQAREGLDPVERAQAEIHLRDLVLNAAPPLRRQRMGEGAAAADAQRPAHAVRDDAGQRIQLLGLGQRYPGLFEEPLPGGVGVERCAWRRANG